MFWFLIIWTTFMICMYTNSGDKRNKLLWYYFITSACCSLMISVGFCSLYQGLDVCLIFTYEAMIHFVHEHVSLNPICQLNLRVTLRSRWTLFQLSYVWFRKFLWLWKKFYALQGWSDPTQQGFEPMSFWS